MSELDRDVLALLDRAATHAPPLHLAREDVVARGAQIVRRRRAVVGGMSLGGLALAGAAWWGLAGGGVLGAHEIEPAGVTWEVDEPTTVTVIDGVMRGGNVSPLTVTKDGDGATATFSVEGHEETVKGSRMAGGADVFVGERATVVMWEQPPAAGPNAQLVPAPGGWESGEVPDVTGLNYLTTTDSGYEPDDILFYDESSVWTASGEVAQTGLVGDDRLRLTAFSLPGVGVAGFLEQGSLSVMPPGWTSGSGSVEPWWRGGEKYEYVVARLPEEAVWARIGWGDRSGAVVHHGDSVSATRLEGAAFAVFSFTEEEAPEGRDAYAYTYQWSSDGSSWHDQEVEDEPLPTTFENAITFDLDAQGRLVASREGQQPTPAQALNDGAWVLRDDRGSIMVTEVPDEQAASDMTSVPVVRKDGHAQRSLGLVDSSELQAGKRQVLAARLPDGVDFLGTAASRDSASSWSLLGGETVASTDVGGVVRVAVDEGSGLWAAYHLQEGEAFGSEKVVVGEVDGPGVVLDIDGAVNRVAVVQMGATVGQPVLRPGAVVVGEHSTGPVTVTEVQCLKSQETCVDGLDGDGDGQLDRGVLQDTIFAWGLDESTEGLPVVGADEHLTLLGTVYTVRDDVSGWPVLRPDGMSGSTIRTAPAASGREPSGRGIRTVPEARLVTVDGRWPWSPKGAVVTVPDKVFADDVVLVVQDSGGHWHEPDQRVVVQGADGSVTLLGFAPDGADGLTDVVGIQNADGRVTPVE